jgi:hypothetical protein
MEQGHQEGFKGSVDAQLDGLARLKISTGEERKTNGRL